MVSPKGPTTLMTPDSYPKGHKGYSFVSKISRKQLKTGYDDTYLHNLLFYTQISFMGQLVVFNYPFVSPKVQLHLGPQIITLWATIATHLRAKTAENTQIRSLGQQVVFNYPMVSPKIPTTLTNPYSYPIGHHSPSFVIENGWKWLKIVFLTILHFSHYGGPFSNYMGSWV
jgi:hypothetical protein